MKLDYSEGTCACGAPLVTVELKSYIEEGPFCIHTSRCPEVCFWRPGLTWQTSNWTLAESRLGREEGLDLIDGLEASVLKARQAYRRKTGIRWVADYTQPPPQGENVETGLWLAKLRTILHDAPEDTQTREVALEYAYTHLVGLEGVDAEDQIVPVRKKVLAKLRADSKVLANWREIAKEREAAGLPGMGPPPLPPTTPQPAYSRIAGYGEGQFAGFEPGDEVAVVDGYGEVQEVATVSASPRGEDYGLVPGALRVWGEGEPLCTTPGGPIPATRAPVRRVFSAEISGAAAEGILAGDTITLNDGGQGYRLRVEHVEHLSVWPHGHDGARLTGEVLEVTEDGE